MTTTGLCDGKLYLPHLFMTTPQTPTPDNAAFLRFDGVVVRQESVSGSACANRNILCKAGKIPFLRNYEKHIFALSFFSVCASCFALSFLVLMSRRKAATFPE